MLFDSKNIPKAAPFVSLFLSFLSLLFPSFLFFPKRRKPVKRYKWNARHCNSSHSNHRTESLNKKKKKEIQKILILPNNKRWRNWISSFSVFFSFWSQLTVTRDRMKKNFVRIFEIYFLEIGKSCRKMGIV